MGTTLLRRQFTVDEYHSMARAGILLEDDRVEPIEGEIVEMSPIGRGHAFSVTALTHLLVTGVGDRALVSVQNPVRLSSRSEPQPDVTLLRRRPDYREVGVGPADVLLLIEVGEAAAGHLSLARGNPGARRHHLRGKDPAQTVGCTGERGDDP